MSTGNNCKKQPDKMPAPLEHKHPKSMMVALKTVIMRERDRKRQEEEMADKIVERRKQEQEKLRKKREAESLTLEQTKEQITSLEKKLKSLRGEKHDLFLQLKKVLNESENRRKQIKEQTHAMRPAINDYSISHPSHHQYPQIPMHGSHMISVGGTPLHSRPSMLSDKMFKPQTPPAPQGIKRARSPSPPVVDLYPQHALQQAHFPPGTYPAGSFRPRGHPPYTTAQASSAFITQSQSGAGGAAGYPPHRQPAGLHGTFPSGGGQSNPTKYQATGAARDYGPILHYPHESQGDHYPPGFHGYTPGAVQGGLDSAKSSSYADEHYQSKLQSQHLRPMAAVHAGQALPHQALLSQQVSHIQQAQNKGLAASYQSRRKPESPVYGTQKKPGPQPHGATYQGSSQQVRPSGYSSSQGHGQHGGGRYY